MHPEKPYTRLIGNCSTFIYQALVVYSHPHVDRTCTNSKFFDSDEFCWYKKDHLVTLHPAFREQRKALYQSISCALLSTGLPHISEASHTGISWKIRCCNSGTPPSLFRGGEKTASGVDVDEVLLLPLRLGGRPQRHAPRSTFDTDRAQSARCAEGGRRRGSGGHGCTSKI